MYASPEHLAAPWRRCGVWGAVSPPGSRASPLPLQNIYRGPEHRYAAVSRLSHRSQAIFMALAAAAEGYTAFTETVFPRRWAHVEELRRLGADITVVGSHAVIRGAPLIRVSPHLHRCAPEPLWY